jgi:hypothetical protein
MFDFSIQITTVVDSLEPVFLFVKPIDPEKLSAAGIVPPLGTLGFNGINNGSNGADEASSVAPYRFHGRIGRGGRLIFDRWNPLTQTPIGYHHISNFPNEISTSLRSYPPPPRLNVEKESADISDLATNR